MDNDDFMVKLEEILNLKLTDKQKNKVDNLLDDYLYEDFKGEENGCEDPECKVCSGDYDFDSELELESEGDSNEENF